MRELTELVEKQQAENTRLIATLKSYDLKMKKVISAIDGLGDSASALHKACEAVLK